MALTKAVVQLLLATSSIGSFTDARVSSQGLLHEYRTDRSCKCFPGDSCWPEPKIWAQLNNTVDGRLIKTVPLGSPCHGDAYNAAECQKLKDGWLYSDIQYVIKPSLPYYANSNQHGFIFICNGSDLCQPEL